MVHSMLLWNLLVLKLGHYSGKWSCRGYRICAVESSSFTGVRTRGAGGGGQLPPQS